MDWANMSAEEAATEIKKIPYTVFISDEKKSYNGLVALIKWRRAMKLKTGKPKLTKSFGAKNLTIRTADGLFVTFPAEYTDGETSKGYDETLVWRPGYPMWMSEIGHSLSEEQLAALMSASPNAAEQYKIRMEWEDECRRTVEKVAADLLSTGKNAGYREKMRSQAADKAYKYIDSCKKIWDMDDEDILTLMRMLEKGNEVEWLSKYINANRHTDTGLWDLEFIRDLRARAVVKRVMTE